MPTVHLTDIAVRALASPASGQVDYWDAKTPGFGVRVSQAGAKTFVVKANNRRRTIGRYGMISLQDARKRALAIKSESEPIVVSKLTFEDAYQKFEQAHISAKKVRTQRDYKRIIEKYFLPELAKVRIATITFHRISGITDKLVDTPSEQAHALAVARTFFRWCVRPPRRYIPYSPLEGLQLRMGKSRKRVLSDAELVAIWNAAEEQGHPHGTVVQLLILTGQRRGEVVGLLWPWISERERNITLPDRITKNGSEHTIPYGDMTAAILERVPRRNVSDLLFPSRWADDRPFSGWATYKKKMADGVAHWTLHDLRRTFATRLAQLQTPPHVIERLLNHKFGSISNKTDSIVTAVAEVYNRYAYLPEMREAITKWEAYLTNLLQQSRDVLPRAA